MQNNSVLKNIIEHISGIYSLRYHGVTCELILYEKDRDSQDIVHTYEMGDRQDI